MASMTATESFKPKLWTAGDVNAFFGFGTNILVNMLVLTGLLRFVLKMPDAIVFGRILPAMGLMMCLSTFYYAYLAYSLAKRTGRSDVCALPSGISVPHMFIVTFVIMLPIALKTGDPVQGWEAGLVWVFFQSFILMIGGFIAPWVRKITPRAALLGTLAGVSITFISMRPALEMYQTPVIGLTCFAIIMVNWLGGFKYPKGIPAGLVAIAVGMLIAWGSNLFGLNYGGLSLKGVGDAFVIEAGAQADAPAAFGANQRRANRKSVAGRAIEAVIQVIHRTEVILQVRAISAGPRAQKRAGFRDARSEHAPAKENVVEKTAERFRVRQRHRLRALVRDGKKHMVLQIRANAGKIEHDFDAELFEIARGADARKHQQLR